MGRAPSGGFREESVLACFKLRVVAGSPQHVPACSPGSDFCFSLHMAVLPDSVAESPPPFSYNDTSQCG